MATAQHLVNTAKINLLQAKAYFALTELGRSAFERFGEEAGPVSVIRPILEERDRIKSLETGTQQLSRPKEGQLVGPKLFAIAYVLLVLLIVVTLT